MLRGFCFGFPSVSSRKNKRLQGSAYVFWHVLRNVRARTCFISWWYCVYTHWNQRLSVPFPEFRQIRILLRDTYVASFLKKYLRGGTVRTCCSTKISLLQMFLLGNSLACKAWCNQRCGRWDLAQECLRCTTSHGVLPTLSKFPRPSKKVAMREAICIHIGQALRHAEC